MPPAFDLTQCDRLVHEALAADPRNSRALNALGALWRATGKPQEAIEAYGAAAAVNRNDANAHWVLQGGAAWNCERWQGGAAGASRAERRGQIRLPLIYVNAACRKDFVSFVAEWAIGPVLRCRRDMLISSGIIF
jgi:tetratricopeptide (TPR) repeat protein